MVPLLYGRDFLMEPGFAILQLARPTLFRDGDSSLSHQVEVDHIPD